MKQTWKPGNMLYPLPAVLITARGEEGLDDVCTVAWAGTVCTNPPMVSISLRPSRLTYQYIMETGVFAINLTDEDLVHATDYCGVVSGRDQDKFQRAHLTKIPAEEINCPMIEESPVNIECRVRETEDLGSHTMFLADIVAVHADQAYMDEKGRFHFERTKPIVYSHGEYRSVGGYLGKFGYSVQKKKNRRKKS
jgi:flavin reductase (DIM6/NTAB) family NADH-FMN oxidoreductase RutF